MNEHHCDDPAHARMYAALIERAERAEARVTRVEALADPADGRYCTSPGCTCNTALFARDLRIALAEPDEEGGR